MFAAGSDVAVPWDHRNLERLAQLRESLPLVINERFQGTHVKNGPKLRFQSQQVCQDWKKCRFGFSGCGRCRNDDVAIGFD